MRNMLTAVMVLLLVAVGTVSAQLKAPADEAFNYSLGQLTAGGGGANVSGGRWVSSSGTGNYLPVVSANLTYPNYGLSGTGKAIQMVYSTSSSEDAYFGFDSVTTGEVVAAFLLNVDSLTNLSANGGSGDYMAALLPNSSTSTYASRLGIRYYTDSTGYQLGIRGSSSGTMVWDTTKRVAGTTYFVGISYRFVAGADNDTAYLYVNPTLVAGMAAPNPSAKSAVAAGQELLNVSRFALRQNRSAGPPAIATPSAKIAGLRIDDHGRFTPTAKVTFRVNTSTVKDTILPASTVQVRGANWPITWGDDSPKMTHVSGDYWTATYTYEIGTTVTYKYYVAWGGNGWEDGSDKTVTVSGDTVLAQAYWNGGTTPPYTPSDTVDVWFRVNMGSRPDFDPATDAVQVRGSFNGWGTGNDLTREGTSKFYSGVVRRPNVATEALNYKFTFTKGASTYWEDAIGDRVTTLWGNDTTLVWKTFENKAIVQVLPVNVTFIVNTSTIPDTLKSTSFIQMRGGTPPLTWDQNSPVMFTNIGGDYWTATAQFFPGATVQYKIFTFAKPTLTADDYGAGWENNTTDGSGNRTLTVGNGDTTLPLAFVNGSASAQTQYWRPYVDAASDTVRDVWFRVNVQSREDFNVATDSVVVRGSFNGWGATNLRLVTEAQHGNNGSRKYDATKFWSGVASIPVAQWNGGDVMYKFVILSPGKSDSWESRSDRALPKPTADTTLYWKWFNDTPFTPSLATDTVVVTFRANVARAISERGFAHGDTIQVRSGFNATAKEVRTKTLLRQGLSTIYAVTDTVVGLLTRPLNYQYYVIKNAVDIREIYYDFTFLPRGDAAAERRRVTLTSNTITVQDTATSTVESRRSPRFRNTQRLTGPVNVTYTVDVRPAYYQLKAGSQLVATNITPHVLGNKDSVFIWGVWMNGPAVGGWDIRGAWGSARRADTLSKMFDDGTHGDVVAGDSVYSLKWRYTNADFTGQEFKFGIGALDNEGGFGNNHIENISLVSPTDTFATIASQFGSIDPVFYTAWDFDNKVPKAVTAVEANDVPLTFSLRQNFPNPFNPSTTIQYDLPVESDVTLKVFNTLGQEVGTVLTGRQLAGSHSVTFDAKNLASGVYFYQIKAGDFTSLKKMVLIK